MAFVRLDAMYYRYTPFQSSIIPFKSSQIPLFKGNESIDRIEFH